MQWIIKLKIYFIHGNWKNKQDKCYMKIHKKAKLKKEKYKSND